MLRVANLPPRRRTLGAEELLELGEVAPLQTLPASNVVPSGVGTSVSVSSDEAKLMLSMVESIVVFSKDFPVEFHSYCPAERWEKALTAVGTWASDVEAKLERGVRDIRIPEDVLWYLMDLEHCISAARDARLSSARWAFTLSSLAGIASWALGMTWLGVPAYLAGLALLYGRPLYAKYQAEPQTPFKPVLQGRRRGLNGCEPPPETPEEARQVKYLERVVVPASGGSLAHYWGTLQSSGDMGLGEYATCLAKGRFRIRVEGWTADRVMPAPGWRLADICEPTALNVVGVVTVGEARGTRYGPLPEHSRHDEDYWVEYVGPLTGGMIRRAGPFGCPFDTRDHAVEDSGILDRGRDGDYQIFDGEGNPIEAPAEEAVR
jgi:hypothetical protein